MALCETCSAPLPPSRNICSYCGTRNDVDLKGRHKFKAGKPETGRNCPCCKVPMKSLELDIDGKFCIERCDKCLGMFFDPGELDAVLDRSVSETFSADIEKITNLFNELDRENFRVAYRRCPVCGEIMHRLNFGAGSGVIIDSCKPHGIWLDGGELKRIMEWKKAGGQVLDAQKKALMEAEQLKEEKRRLRKNNDTAGGMDIGPDDPYILNTNIITSVFRLVSRLF